MNVDEQNVVRILSARNHYQTLDVGQNAPATTIETSYKRIALLVHTDKNKAPRAKEAMQKVNEAREVLSDPVKRIVYDYILFGNNIEVNDVPNPGPNQHEFADDDESNTYEPETDGSKYDFPNERNRTRWWEGHIGFYIMVLLPVILLILVPSAILSLEALFTTPPVFSLTPNSKYVIPKRTMSQKIPYYVTKNFQAEFNVHYNGHRKNLEIDVKNEYKTKLEIDCNRELRQKEYWLEMVRSSKDFKEAESMNKVAQSIETLSCQKLQSLFDSSHKSSLFSYIFKSLTKYLLP
ncbi:dnaJ homolog subfamily B member 14-like isoform X2 [Contarinia nasturtii]|nr:dnaJ homolog subfamily B member 14-like isoform X2 [Contarinia nasturtii]